MLSHNAGSNGNEEISEDAANEDTISYGVRKVDFIRTSIAGYAGGIAIANELIQNADDACANFIEFNFTYEALVVINDRPFSEKNFKDITQIGSGGKREEQEKIGTWGTGFMSVYQLTDKPELKSAGKHLIFDPNKEKLPFHKSEVTGSTEFRFPWRREFSHLAKELDAECWTDVDINKFIRSLEVEIYRQILFLRSVRTIKVSQGSGPSKKILYRVSKSLVETITNPENNFTREKWKIEYQNIETGSQPVTDIWCYYRGVVPNEELPNEQYKVKGQEVSIAFPSESKPWLEDNLPGCLYNFLPTGINTRFEFQINGPFAPDANRHSILTNDNSVKSQWNFTLIKRLAQLFVDAVNDIVSLLMSKPAWFQKLIPLTSNSEYKYLTPIVELFTSEASKKKIVYIEQEIASERWIMPSEVKISSNIPLGRLFEPYLKVLPENTDPTFRDFLIEPLNSQYLTIYDVLEFIRGVLSVPIKIEEAHEVINNPENLQIIYHEVSKEWKRLGKESENRSDLEKLLRETPFYLSQDGYFYNYNDNIWCGSDEARDLDLPSTTRFVLKSVQDKADFNIFLEPILGLYNGDALVEELETLFEDIDFDEDLGLELYNAPLVINSKEKLTQVLHFLSNNKADFLGQKLQNLPLVLDSENKLQKFQNHVYFLNKPRNRDQNLFNLFSFKILNDEIITDSTILTIYRKAELVELTPSRFINELEALNLSPTLIMDARAPLNQLETIQQVLEYFWHYRDDLRPEDLKRLSQLPIFLTQKNWLLPLVNNNSKLMLPGEVKLKGLAIPLDLLDIKDVIHAELLRDNNKEFLEDFFDVKELLPLKMVTDYIIPLFKDTSPPYGHHEKLDLLHYVKSVWDTCTEEEREQLENLVYDVNLLRTHNDEYNVGNVIYFPSDLLDELFLGNYLRVHGCYEGLKWNDFLSMLGVQTTPKASDLIKTVEDVLTSDKEIGDKIKFVKLLYNHTNDLWKNEAKKSIEGRKTEQNPFFQQFSELSKLRWLPCPNKDEQWDWYLPSEVYQPNYINLVGKQVPILRFEETQSDLSKFLRMPTSPDAALIASHLLNIIKSQEAISYPLTKIYDHLGKNWVNLPSEYQQALKNEKVVKIDNRFWKGTQVFLQNWRPLFGEYRGYVLETLAGEHTGFFDKVGVKQKPLFGDCIFFLQELADTYLPNPEERIISDQDKNLVWEIFDYIGRLPDLSINDEDREKLRSLPIFLTERGRLSSINDPHQPLTLPDTASSTDGPGALLSKLDLDIVIHHKLANGSGRNFLHKLEVRTLSSYVAITTYFLPRYQDLTDDVLKLDVVIFIRSFWVAQQDSGSSQQEGLVQELIDLALIRCSDDKYRACNKIYFASEQLDKVFGDSYARPHHIYKLEQGKNKGSEPYYYRMSSWYSFLLKLGVKENPAPIDLVEIIERTVASKPVAGSIAIIRNIYEFLNNNIGEPGYSENEQLKKLRQIKWLPSKNHVDSWVAPHDLYQASQGEIVGKQAPLLNLGETTTKLRDFLEMPSTVPPVVSASHLLELVKNKQEPSPRLYSYLGQNWEKLEQTFQQKLKQEKIVWILDSFWSAEQVFFENYSEYFGIWRGYLTTSLEANTKILFERIGVKKDKTVTDHFELLRAIANEYTLDTATILSKIDFKLIMVNFDYLGLEWAMSDNSEQFDEARTILQDLAIIPGRDKRLHPANRIVEVDEAQIYFLKKFEPNKIAVLENGDTQDGKILTNNAYKFLRILGVRSINQVIKRELLEKENLDYNEEFTQLVRQLPEAFMRIAATIERQESKLPGRNDTDLYKDIKLELSDIRVYTCNLLQVKYSLDYNLSFKTQHPDESTIVEGYVVEEAALYHKTQECSEIYLKKHAEENKFVLLLALELEKRFFPNSSQNVTIEQLLKSTPQDWKGYLDDHDFRNAYADAITLTKQDAESDHQFAQQGNESTEDVAVISPQKAESFLELEEPSHNTSSSGGPYAIKVGKFAGDQIHVKDSIYRNNNSNFGITSTINTEAHNIIPERNHITIVNEVPVKKIISPITNSSSSSQMLTPTVPKTILSQSSDWEPACEPIEIQLTEEHFLGTEELVSSIDENRTVQHRSNVIQTLESETRLSLSKLDRDKIGAWGEESVIIYLVSKYRVKYPLCTIIKKDEQGGFTFNLDGKVLVEINTPNNSEQLAVGYDIKVIEDGIENLIEVKTSSKNGEDGFELTRSQWELAREKFKQGKGNNFHIYRVYNAGTYHAALIIITNPYQKWFDQSITGYPVKIYLK